MVYAITSGVNIEKVDKGSVFKEIYISFIASIPFFTQGIQSFSLSSSVHSGHFIHDESGQVPWTTTAYVLAAAAAAPLFCYSSDRVGRKVAVFSISIIQGISLIPLFIMNSTSTIFFHVFAGVSLAGIVTILPVYIIEITSPKIRGPCLMLMMVMAAGGYMTKLAMNLEETMYVMTALVMAQLVMMISVVETPSYLVMCGKLEKAKTSIASLKMLPENSVHARNQLETLRKEKERALANGKLSIRIFYRTKIWWDALKITILLYTTMGLCGSIVFLDQDKTLMQLKLTGDPQNLLVLSSMLAGTLFSFLAINILDRKYLLTMGYTIMALSSGVIAVYTQVDLTVTSLQWLAVVSLVALVFGYGMSWGLPAVILVEMFNFEIRSTVIGMLFTYSQLLKLLHVHTFKYIEDYVGIYSAFYIFASINLYGAVYSLFAIPNIRNKTLRQIERQMKRTPLPA